MGLAGMRIAVRAALLDAWALVQPVDCLGCGEPDRALCTACRRAIAPSPTRIRCDAGPGVPVIAASDYAGAVRGALLSLKEDQRLDAARPLATLLRSGLSAIGAMLGPDGPPTEVAWIPSRGTALRRRGYDPVREILATARVPASAVLATGRDVRAQKSLARDERLAARHRFRPRRALTGRRFVLVDDVVTTGATIADGVRAIRSAGGEVIAAVGVAAPDLAARRIRNGAG